MHLEMSSKRLFGRINQIVLAVGIVALMALGMTSQAQAAQWRIGVIVYDGVLTSDVTGPLEVFGAASRKAWFSDYEVFTISADPDKNILTEEGLKITADFTLDDAGKFDILIAPSSYGMRKILANKALIAFVRSHKDSAKWLASNCSGAQILAEAGILDGKNATTWFGGEKAFQNDYPKVKVHFDTNVVIDGNIITSNGGLVSYEAALVLLGKMISVDFATEIATALQYDRLTSFVMPK